MSLTHVNLPTATAAAPTTPGHTPTTTQSATGTPKHAHLTNEPPYEPDAGMSRQIRVGHGAGLAFKGGVPGEPQVPGFRIRVLARLPRRSLAQQTREGSAN